MRSLAARLRGSQNIPVTREQTATKDLLSLPRQVLLYRASVRQTRAITSMKICAFPALLSLLFASLAPAADLIFEGDTLNPKTTLELRFDTPMISKERVGSVEQKNLPLV